MKKRFRGLLPLLLLIPCLTGCSSIGEKAASLSNIYGAAAVLSGLLLALGLVLPFAAIAITSCVIRYMALFDIYRSMDPGNAVLYLVLSILFSPTEPFFLFFNREKDLGMPPRKQRTVEAEYVEAEIV
jgi:hypothetical protein